MQNRRTLILFSIFIILYEFNTYIANDMIMPGMVQVIAEFHASSDKVAESLSLYILGGCLLQFFLAPLCDRIGYKQVMVGGNLLFLIASIVIPFTQSIDQFLLARVFQGMGLCFIFIGYAVIHENFDDKSAVKLTAIIGNVTIFAPLIGPVVGAAISAYANWRFVFVITVIFAIISFFGLSKTMPDNKHYVKHNVIDIMKTYAKITRTRVLLQGGVVIFLCFLPMLNWIGISPILIMKTMGLNYTHYVIYQIIVCLGFVISSIAMQFIADRYSFYVLITRGVTIATTGIIIAFIFHQNIVLFLLGMSIATLGQGIFSGSVFRIAITSTGLSNSMSGAVMNIIQSGGMALGLELMNIYCNKFNYSLFSFTSANAVISILCLIVCYNFAIITKSRVEQ